MILKGNVQGSSVSTEMERDALISHGAPALLKERMCLSSDAYQAVFCVECGVIAIADHIHKKYSCPKCGQGEKEGSFGRCVIPQVFKTLMHYLAAMGINLSLKTKIANQ